jgi:hypothetical protein
MKFISTKPAKIAIAAAVSGAMLLPATGAFAASKTERAILGGLLGAAAGAAVTGGDTDGVVIGAAAGSVLGIATAKKKHYYNRSYRSSRPYYRESSYRTYDRAPRSNRYYYDDYNHGYYRY